MASLTVMMHLFSSKGPQALWNQRNRMIPILWNPTSGYASKSVEEKLGLNKPKRPMNPFLKFVGQVRPTILAKNPDSDAVEVIKIASKHWKQLGDDIKSKLSSEYEKDTQDYKKALVAFNASLSREQLEDIKKLSDDIATAKEKRKVKAELKELGKPKQPMSSYLLYCQSLRNNSNKKEGFVEFQIKAKDKWYSMPKSEKDTWERKANELRDAYRKELSKWEEKMIRIGNVDFVRSKPSTTSKKTSTKQISA